MSRNRSSLARGRFETPTRSNSYEGRAGRTLVSQEVAEFNRMEREAERESLLRRITVRPYEDVMPRAPLVWPNRATRPILGVRDWFEISAIPVELSYYTWIGGSGRQMTAVVMEHIQVWG